MRPIVQSTKKYVQWSLDGTVAGAIEKKDIVKAKDIDDVSAVVDVVAGSIIKAVYVELWITSDDATQSTFVFTIEKRTTATTAMTAAEAAALNDYHNKKNIFYTSMGLTGPKVDNPMPAFRGWIRIPKGKQRFGLEDVLSWNILAQSDGINHCGFATYKAYT